jgi:hypothetical protein
VKVHQRGLGPDVGTKCQGESAIASLAPNLGDWRFAIEGSVRPTVAMRRR